MGQHGLRYAPKHIHRMMDFVADGGVWNEAALRRDMGGSVQPPLIQLSEFSAEPGGPTLLLVHDGHHRLVATHLAGRDFLYPDEHRVTRWSYEDYLAINLACGWVTPFDPRIHARTADFSAWKKQILPAAEDDPGLAECLIREQPRAYREPRRYSDIASLACDCCSLELEPWRLGRQVGG